MDHQKRITNRYIHISERLQKLQSDIVNYPLIVVEAPMGYGKTTFVRALIQRHSLQAHWLKLYDDNLIVFWQCLCDLIAGIDPTVAQALSHIGFPTDALARYEALKILSSITLEKPWVVVIDDYHLVHSEAVDSWIDYITQNDITNLQIILTARTIDLKNLQTLKIRGQLALINQNHLAFTPEEILAYYKQCAYRITHKEAQHIYEQTEGWASALYLLLVAYQETGRMSDTSSINTLIDTALFVNQPETHQRLLIDLAFTKVVTNQGLAQLTQEPRANHMLRSLAHQNAFIKYDSFTQTFHIHGLFQNYLASQFATLSTQEQNLIYERYALWSISEGQFGQAMHYYYQTKNYIKIMAVIELDMGNTIDHGQKDDVIKYFDTCPQEVLDAHPTAILIFALCLFSMNEMAGFEKACQLFLSIMDKQTHLSDRDRDNLLGEFQLLLAFTQYNHIGAMHAHIACARELLTRPSQFLDTKSSWTFGAPSVLYMFYRESGALEAHVKGLEQSLPTYSELMLGHGSGGDYLMRAEWSFSHGDCQNAEISMYQALEKAQRYKQSDLVVGAYFIKARIALAKGDRQQAKMAVDASRYYVEGNGHYHLMHTQQLCEAFLALCSGKSHVSELLEAIPEWILTADLESSRLFFPAGGFLNIVYGRVLLEQKEHLKLLGEMPRLLEVAGIFPNLLSAVYLHIYSAIANYAVFRKKQAMDSLLGALSIALPDRLYMPFIENGQALGRLFTDVKSQKNTRPEIIEGIAAIETLLCAYQVAEQFARSDSLGTKTQPLTTRELEIALLAAEGLTNKAIGERLFISTNTVKVALKSVFSKLGIHHRALLADKLTQGDVHRESLFTKM